MRGPSSGFFCRPSVLVAWQFCLGSPQQNHHLGVVEEDGQALHRFCDAELWRLANILSTFVKHRVALLMCTDVPVVGPFGTRQHSRPQLIL